MLVQLSPWQSCSTSVSVSSKRRRQSGAQQEQYPLELAASFVTATKRNRQKKKLKKQQNHQQQEEPTIVVTSAHHVSVVGQTSSREHQLQECSQWHYQSRPGRTTSFLPAEKTVNGSKQSHTSLEKIPAIFDARNDKVYALQNGNSTLSCWNANTSSGPDDTDVPSQKIELSCAAMSLSILPFQQGIVYGSLQDGRLFLAQWTAHDTLQVQYSKPVQMDGMHHVHTFVQASSSSSTGSRAGQKRKATGQDGGLCFYQVFSKQNGILLFRNEVNLTLDDCLEEARVQALFIDLTSSLQDANGMVVDCNDVTVSQVDESKIAVVFSVARRENGNTTNQQRSHYCAPMDLENGRLARVPFPLASHTRHASAVTPFLLAAATLDEVLLYDIAHGSVVHRAIVTDLVGDCKNWSLIADAKRGRLAVLSVQNGHAHVCYTMATLDGVPYQKAQQEGNAYNLAAGLRSSLGLSPMGESLVAPSKCFLGPASENEESLQTVDDCVTEALIRLQACIDEIQDPDNTDIQPFHFMNEYEHAVGNILSACQTPTSKKRPGSAKAASRKALLANGVHHAEASDSTQDTEETSTASRQEENNGSLHHGLVNGLKESNKIRGYTPSSLPQRFVDGATSVVLSVLQLPQVENKAIGIRSKLARLDARLILSRLIRTGKVSARRHFDSSLDHGCGHHDDHDTTSDCFFATLRSLKLTNKGNTRVFSPVDLMHEMISLCPDISEGQMITMIHFMLCKALPEDIAENFLDHGNLKPGHPYRVLAKRFVQVRSAQRKQHGTSKVGVEDMAKLEEQEGSLSLKLVRAGATILVGRLVQYSRCNEVLLRNAMSEGLSANHEPVILAHVLVDLLNDHEKNAIFPAMRQSRHMSTTALISKWIFTLCEACRECLVASDDGNESPLSRILVAVRAHVKDTETIMTLHDVVYQFGAVKAEEKESEMVEVDKLAASVSHKREAAPVPPYSIERLAF